MIFESPEYLFALVLIAFPAVFYLSRYIRSRKLVFPAAYFMFERDMAPVRRIKSRQIGIALIRMLLLAVLTVGFAGPATVGVYSLAPSTAGNRVVVVLDVSPSMLSRGEAGPLTERARMLLRDRLGGLDSGTLVALTVCPGKAGSQRLTWMTPSAAADALDGLVQSSSPCQIEHAVKRVLGLSDEAMQVWVVSDFQLSEAEAEPLERLLSEEPNVVLLGVESRRTNLSLRRVRWDSGLEVEVENPETVKASASLKVACGDKVNRTATELGAGSTRVLEVQLPEGSDPGLCTIGLDEDSWNGDNTLYFSLNRPETATWVVVDGSGTAAAGRSASFYVSSALASNRKDTSIIQVSQSEFTYDHLSFADGVVLIDPMPMPDYLVDGLADYVKLGGRVMVFAGVNLSTWPSDNSLFPDLESRSCGTGLDAPFFPEWFEPESELLAGLASLNTSLKRGWISVRHSALSIQDARVLARFNDGAPLLLERKSGSGQVVVLAFVPGGDNGIAVFHPMFPILVGSAADFMVPQRQEVTVPLYCQAGRNCRLEPKDASGRLFEDESGNRVALSGNGDVTCQVPGPYLTAGAEYRALAFVCSYPSEERASSAGWAPSLQRPEPGKETPVFETRQSLAPHVLLAGLVLLLFEMGLITGRFVRK